jgi:hypothetical protein
MLLCQINQVNNKYTISVCRTATTNELARNPDNKLVADNEENVNRYLNLIAPQGENESVSVAQLRDSNRRLFVADLTQEFLCQPFYSVAPTVLTKVIAGSQDLAVRALLNDILSGVNAADKNELVRKILGVLANLTEEEERHLPETFRYLEAYLGKTPGQYLNLPEKKTQRDLLEDLFDQASKNSLFIVPNYSGLAAGDELEKNFNDSVGVWDFVRRLPNGASFESLFARINGTGNQPLAEPATVKSRSRVNMGDIYFSESSSLPLDLPLVKFKSNSAELLADSEFANWKNGENGVIELFKKYIGYELRIDNIVASINQASSTWAANDHHTYGETRALVYLLMLYAAFAEHLHDIDLGIIRELKDGERGYFETLLKNIGEIVGDYSKDNRINTSQGRSQLAAMLLETKKAALEKISAKHIFAYSGVMPDAEKMTKIGKEKEFIEFITKRETGSREFSYVIDNVEYKFMVNGHIPANAGLGFKDGKWLDYYNTPWTPQGYVSEAPSFLRFENGKWIDNNKIEWIPVEDRRRLASPNFLRSENGKWIDSYGVEWTTLETEIGTGEFKGLEEDKYKDMARSARLNITMQKEAKKESNAVVDFDSQVVSNNFSELEKFNEAYQAIVENLHKVDTSDTDALKNGTQEAREAFNKFLSALKGSLSAQLSVTPVVVDILVSSVIPAVIELDALIKKFEQKIEAAGWDVSQISNTATVNDGEAIEQKIKDLFASVNKGERLTAVDIGNIWVDIAELQRELDAVKETYANLKNTDYKIISYTYRKGTLGDQILNYVLTDGAVGAEQTGAITKSSSSQSFKGLEILESKTEIAHTLNSAQIEDDLEVLRKFLRETETVYREVSNFNKTSPRVFAQLDEFAQNLGEQKLNPGNDYLLRGPHGNDGLAARLGPLRTSWAGLVKALRPLRSRAAEKSTDLFFEGARIVIAQTILKGLPEQLNVGSINKEALAVNIADALNALQSDNVAEFDARIADLREAIQLNESLEEVFKRIIALVKSWFKAPLTDEDAAIRSAIDKHPVLINPPKGIEPHVQKMIDDLHIDALPKKADLRSMIDVSAWQFAVAFETEAGAPRLSDILKELNSRYNLLLQFQEQYSADVQAYTPEERDHYKAYVLVCAESYNAALALLDATYLNDTVRADEVLAEDVRSAEALRASLLARLMPHLDNVVQIYKLEAEEKIRDPRSYSGIAAAGECPDGAEITSQRAAAYAGFMDETTNEFKARRDALEEKFPGYDNTENEVDDLKNIVKSIAESTAVQIIWAADDSDAWQGFITKYNTVQGLKNKNKRSSAEDERLERDEAALREIENGLRGKVSNDTLTALFELADNLRKELLPDDLDPELKKIIEFFYTTLVPVKPSIDENVFEIIEATKNFETGLSGWIDPENPHKFDVDIWGKVYWPVISGKQVPGGNLSAWWGLGGSLGLHGDENEYHVSLPGGPIMVRDENGQEVPVIVAVEEGKTPSIEDIPEHIREQISEEDLKNVVWEKIGEVIPGGKTKAEPEVRHQTNGKDTYVEDLPDGGDGKKDIPTDGLNPGESWEPGKKEHVPTGASGPTGAFYTDANGGIVYMEDLSKDNNGDPILPAHSEAGKSWVPDPAGATSTGITIWTPGTDYGYYADGQAPAQTAAEKWDKITDENQSGNNPLEKVGYTEQSSSTADASGANSDAFVSDTITQYTSTGETASLNPVTLYAPNDQDFQLKITFTGEGGVNIPSPNPIILKAAETFVFDVSTYGLDANNKSITINAVLIGGDTDKTDNTTKEVGNSNVLRLKVSGTPPFGYYHIDSCALETPTIKTTTWNTATTYLYRKSTGVAEMKTKILEYNGTYVEKTPLVKYITSPDTQEYQLRLPGEDEYVLQRSLEFRESLTALLRLRYLTADRRWRLGLDLEAGGAASQVFNSVADNGYSSRLWNHLEKTGIIGEEYGFGGILKLDFTADRKLSKAGELNFGLSYNLNTLDDKSRFNISAGYTQELKGFNLPLSLSSWKIHGEGGYDFGISTAFFGVLAGVGFYEDRFGVDFTGGSHIDPNSKYGDAFSLGIGFNWLFLKTDEAAGKIKLGVSGSVHGDGKYNVKPAISMLFNF